MGKVITGQILLIVCCVFYLVWWSISYRPGVTVDRLGGINGILLSVTAVCGIAGMILSIFGINTLPHLQTPKLNGFMLIAAGIAVYFLLLLFTRFCLGRPVTTELVLITGWTVLELSVISSVCAAGRMNDARFYASCAVIAAAFLVSMILYVLYYRMDPMPAFYAAMVPLITEAAGMAVILLLILI